MSSSFWWDLCWPFCSLSPPPWRCYVIHAFVALFSLPVLEVHSKARIKHFQIVIYTCESLKKKKQWKGVKAYLPKHPSIPLWYLWFCRLTQQWNHIPVLWGWRKYLHPVGARILLNLSDLDLCFPELSKFTVLAKRSQASKLLNFY